mmetsp:Transcript_6101/g.24353  ORF Transcript_6101/g.24353 Transcript_6101/m.24353 type:complete len:267 (+) Transcript_6101:774-1574(+)
MLVSMTTHAPPRSSPEGGMYTVTGCSYVLSASTMPEPCCKIPSYKSRRPPEKPRQQANTTTGSASLAMSSSACAVLAALSGYQTCPACSSSTSVAESDRPGSPGTTFVTAVTCVAMTPTGMPPSVARPTTTVCAQLSMSSTKEPSSTTAGMSSWGSGGEEPAAAPPVFLSISEAQGGGLRSASYACTVAAVAAWVPLAAPSTVVWSPPARWARASAASKWRIVLLSSSFAYDVGPAEASGVWRTMGSGGETPAVPSTRSGTAAPGE